jgi:hypothetical protein
VSNVTVHFKDGHSIEFKESGRPGGSYYNRVTYQPGFVVIEDEWGARTAFSTEDISRIDEEAYRRW